MPESVSVAEYRYLREHSGTIASMAAWSGSHARFHLGVSGPEVEAASAFVNADYFRTLGVRIALGRDFTTSDEDYSAPEPVVVISNHLWRNQLGGDPAVVGRALAIGGARLRIIGVVESGFGDLQRGSLRTDLWLPLPALPLSSSQAPHAAAFAEISGPKLDVLAARLRAGASRTSAAAELTALSRGFREAAGVPPATFEVIDTRPASVAGTDVPPGQLRTYSLLLAAACLVLVLSCANAGSLLLARAVGRRAEISIRMALGASRRRVFAQVLGEALFFSSAAVLLGLGLASAAPRLMLDAGIALGGQDGFVRSANAAENLRASFYAPDARIVGFAIALGLATTLFAGLAPAWRAMRVDFAGVISASRHGRTALRAPGRLAFLGVEVALTTVLLVAAGLLVRASADPSSLDTGFAADAVQVVSLAVPRSSAARHASLVQRLAGALGDAGLGPVAVAEQPPLSKVPYFMMARRPDETATTIHRILLRPVSANYFGVLQIPLLSGRAFSEGADSHEVVVSESAADMLWPGSDAIGRTVLSAVTRTEFETCTVVGLAKDVPVRSMTASDPVIYRPPRIPSVLLVRSAARNLPARVRAVAAQVNPDARISTRPLMEDVRQSAGTAGFAARVAGAIGMLGMLLAVAGLFGILSWTVESQRREIAIRLALGAPRQRIWRMVFLAAAWGVLGGLGAGALLSIAVVPLLRHLLFGLNPVDPMAYAAPIVLLLAVAGLATWLAVHRAGVLHLSGALRTD